MEPMTMLALGTAAAGALSGLRGAKLSNKQFQQTQDLAKYQFNAQMNQSVQRRVKDAEAAGIHPLFALGASVGASPTASTNGPTGDAGVASRGLLALADQLGTVGMNRAAARRDEAEAQLLDSERKRIEQTLNTQGRDGVKTFPYGPANPKLAFGPAEYVAPQIPKAKAPGVTAGITPATTDYQFPDGRTIRTYSSELEADEIKQIDILYQRAIHKTSDGFEWLARQLKGKPFIKITKVKK